MQVTKVIMLWSEGWAKENIEFKSIEDFQHFVYRFICPNAPERTQGYDKTKFTVFFANGDEYTGRWDVQKPDAWSYSILDQIKGSLQFCIDKPGPMGAKYAEECKKMLEYINS